MSKKIKSFLFTKINKDLEHRRLFNILNVFYFILFIISIPSVFGKTLLGFFNLIFNPLILALSSLVITTIKRQYRNFNSFIATLAVYIILIIFLSLTAVPVIFGIDRFFGGPLSEIYVKKEVINYLDEKYNSRDYKIFEFKIINSPKHNFKDSSYNLDVIAEGLTNKNKSKEKISFNVYNKINWRISDSFLDNIIEKEEPYFGENEVGKGESLSIDETGLLIKIRWWDQNVMKEDFVERSLGIYRALKEYEIEFSDLNITCDPKFSIFLNEEIIKQDNISNLVETDSIFP